METETPTQPRLLPNPADPDHPYLLTKPVLTLTAEGVTTGTLVVELSTEDLQAIVQQAYDTHGVVAQLWTDSTTNADRGQSGCNGTDHCPATAAHHFDCQAVQG